MSKVNKIKDEELQKIVEKTKEQNEMLRTIGVLETQKTRCFSSISSK